MKKELRYPEAQCDMSVSISSDSDLRISVAHLREVLEKYLARHPLPPLFMEHTIDEIIEQVKKEI